MAQDVIVTKPDGTKQVMTQAQADAYQAQLIADYKGRVAADIDALLGAVGPLQAQASAVMDSWNTHAADMSGVVQAVQSAIMQVVGQAQAAGFSQQGDAGPGVWDALKALQQLQVEFPSRWAEVMQAVQQGHLAGPHDALQALGTGLEDSARQLLDMENANLAPFNQVVHDLRLEAPVPPASRGLNRAQ